MKYSDGCAVAAELARVGWAAGLGVMAVFGCDSDGAYGADQSAEGGRCGGIASGRIDTPALLLRLPFERDALALVRRVAPISWLVAHDVRWAARK